MLMTLNTMEFRQLHCFLWILCVIASTASQVSAVPEQSIVINDYSWSWLQSQHAETMYYFSVCYVHMIQSLIKKLIYN